PPFGGSHGSFSSSAGAGCRLCPQDWQLRGERCYRLSKEQGNWTQGKKDCENQESQLVVLCDQKEKEYIKNITGGGTQPLWIGLSFQKKWTWVDNTPLNTKTHDEMVQKKGRRNPPAPLFCKPGRICSSWAIKFLLCRFGTLPEVDEGCGTLKDKGLEADNCNGDHEWVCQKEPFQLSPSLAGDGEKYDASV
ncbi:killer cell lectin-like receptor subfamily B member 1B allele B, partial [Theristicus caerulescens]